MSAGLNRSQGEDTLGEGSPDQGSSQGPRRAEGVWSRVRADRSAASSAKAP